MDRHQNWYDLNAGRSYPLDDAATRTGDAGERLPNDTLVDLFVRFPETLGRRAYLSSAAVTDTLVTLTVLACPAPDAAGDFVPLAALTARRPLAAGRHLALDPLYPGVGGWAVLGPAETRFSGRFSTPAQGLLLARCARPYRRLPVASVRKAGLAAGLTGIVRLVGGPDVEVVGADRVVDGRARRVIAVRLKAFSGARNVFDLYRGPCGARPETGNCDRPAVEYLNTVGPDCDGNVQIAFGGDVVATPYAGSSEGLVLDHPLGLADACTRRDRLPDAVGRLPNEYDDFCTSEYEGQYPGDADAGGETLPALGVPYTSSQILEPPALPYRETFDDQEAEGWRVLGGAFAFVADDSPDQPDVPPPPGVTYYRDYTVTRWEASPDPPFSSAVVVPSSSLATSSADRPTGHAYEAGAPAGRNVAVWDAGTPATALNVRARADVRLLAGGARINGGLVLNYHTVAAPTPHDEYYAAELDLTTDALRLRRWTGASFAPVAEVTGLGLVLGDWYRLTATVTPGATAGQTAVRVEAAGVSDPAVAATLTATVNRYLPADGRFGVGTDQALARFSYFELTEV